ncbi:iron-hydroxamate ABC transporter substrate-binding protein [Paenibacillus sp. J22TS3]|uniref:iron-hydroxamate ABC transporter substrate-binding protein n=1 Tax=Paenibacillus sp. J22TS3 TaxID=2807192 RepID=UPI001B1F3B30|nr:iron-hydroxamate ABC transporter substrate-binding protein [Paenibacillus sp. J22TS3]GIP22033.1 ferrichrome ABC transporter substrate-binding protein [Paenibacillus sp. J22TS3]
MIHYYKKTNRKFGLLFISLLAVALLLSACGSKASDSGSSSTTPDKGASEQSAAEPKEKEMTDAMGHKVKIPANPQRVLASYLEDHLTALGVKPVAQWSVAKGIQDYLQTDLKGIPTISYDLPVESVLGLSPDLIIIGSEAQVQKGLYEQYSKIAPTYVLGDAVNKDWRQALLKIGEILNKTDQARKAISDYDTKAKEAKENISKAIGGKSAAILWLTQKNFYLVDQSVSSGAVLYGDLGIQPPNLVTDIPADKRASWNPVTLEKLADLKADYIFLVNSDKGQGADDTLNSPVWKGIPAVKEGHVFEISKSSSWLYSGAIAGGKIIDDAVKYLVK